LYDYHHNNISQYIFIHIKPLYVDLYTNILMKIKLDIKIVSKIALRILIKRMICLVYNFDNILYNWRIIIEYINMYSYY